LLIRIQNTVPSCQKYTLTILPTGNGFVYLINQKKVGLNFRF